MKKIIILLSLLILLPLTATSNPLIPIMKTLFTDVTGTVPDAETIKNGEWQNDVGAASSIYEEYYQKLKAGR